MRTINIAKDFSDSPRGRYPGDDEFNATRFREEFLLPALRSEDCVFVEIDNKNGYASSFLEEAFGCLVRDGHFDANTLSKKLHVTYVQPLYIVGMVD